MEDNSPQDELKISEEKLREYLESSLKDPDYESSEKNRRFSSSPTKDELIEMIQKVYQAVSKLDEGTESRTEKCIDLLERLSDACVLQTNVLAEHEQAIDRLKTVVKSNNQTIVILTGLTLLSMSWSLIILMANFTAPTW